MTREERRDMFVAAALTGIVSSDTGQHLSYETATKYALEYARRIMEALDEEKGE